jgi:hypothetical protein
MLSVFAKPLFVIRVVIIYSRELAARLTRG